MNTIGQKAFNRLQKGRPVLTQLQTEDYTINFKNDEVDIMAAVSSLANILDGQKRITEAHESAENFYNDANYLAQRAQNDSEMMLHLLSMREVDDVISHVQQLSSLRGALANYLVTFKQALNEVESLNLNFADEKTAQISSDIDWWQEQLSDAVAQVIGQAKLTRQCKKTIRDNGLDTFVNETFEGYRGDCEQFVGEIKEMCDEIHTTCEQALAQCVTCCLTYDLNIGRVREMQLAKLKEQSLANGEFCEYFHKQSASIINKKLLECDGDKAKFQEGIRTFLEGYKNAYEKHRNETHMATDACEMIAADVRKGDFFVEKNAQQNTDGSPKKGKKQPLSAKQREQIDAVGDAKKLIESTANRARVDYKIDSNEVKNRADAISDAFQAKY